MQVGGVGSGHDTYSHQVTSCLHEHGANTDTGSMGAKSGAAQTATEALQENSKGNLLSWVQNIGNSGKQLLQKIWGDSKESNDAISSQKDGSGNHIAGQETLVTGNSVGVKTTLNRAAVETAATHTYFQPIETREAVPDNTVAESALSGTEGSQKTDGPTARDDSWDPIAEISCRQSNSILKRICGREASTKRTIRRSNAFLRMKAT